MSKRLVSLEAGTETISEHGSLAQEGQEASGGFPNSIAVMLCWPLSQAAALVYAHTASFALPG